jgi:acetyl-CoA acetyltransferase
MLAAGFPHTAGASSVNRFCSSGLKSVQDIANQITLGSIDIGVAMGGESMSQAANRPISFTEDLMDNQESQTAHNL